MLTALLIISYLLIAVVTRTYFKLYRWDHLMSEEMFIVGAFWPLYWLYRLIRWPLGTACGYAEAKMSAFAEKQKEKTLEQKKKVRVKVDREQEEAEHEVEEMLASRRTYR